MQGAFKLKRTLFLLVLAAAATAWMPLTAAAQANPEAASGPSPAPFKYAGYAGFAYTSLNQVNTSRYGLIGAKVSITRDWGKYFGLMGAVDYFKPPIGKGGGGNPGDPSVYTVLAGPEFHANVYGNFSGLFLAEIGVEHTGGESMSPATSLAGGFGGGMEYSLGRRLAIRTVGDWVAASFSLIGTCTAGQQPCSTPSQLGYSTHRTWNPRASVGVVYRF